VTTQRPQPRWVVRKSGLSGTDHRGTPFAKTHTCRLAKETLRSPGSSRPREGTTARAGFLTSRFVALVAAFSGRIPMASWQCAHRLQLREQCRIRRFPAARTSRLSPLGHPLHSHVLVLNRAFGNTSGLRRWLCRDRWRAATGSPEGDQKGTECKTPAAPATVSGELSGHYAIGTRRS